MSTTTIGLLHPGAMGARVGAAAATAANAGAKVVWASAGRSAATHERAREAGLEDVGSLADLVGASDVVLVVCPPDAALDVAKSVAEHDFAGIYVDANAISPATAMQVAETVTNAGASFVDGGIIGPPPLRAGMTRLYLSGSRAPEVAGLFSGSALDARAIGEAPGAASTLKMAYAAWTKGTSALVLAIRALAASEGIEDALLEEWAISQPELAARSVRAAAGAAPKAWRHAGEMREIAATFERAGLPPGFHEAAAAIYDRLGDFKDRADPPPGLSEVIEAINAS